jgi:hypothetical protein
VTVIEPVAGRSWKEVELFGSLRICVSHFYLRSDGGNGIKAETMREWILEASPTPTPPQA